MEMCLVGKIGEVSHGTELTEDHEGVLPSLQSSMSRLKLDPCLLCDGGDVLSVRLVGLASELCVPLRRGRVLLLVGGLHGCNSR